MTQAEIVLLRFPHFRHPWRSYEHFPIYKKAMDIVYLESLVLSYSNYHQYTLGPALRQLSHQVLRHNIRANSERNRHATLEALRDSRGVEGQVAYRQGGQGIRQFPFVFVAETDRYIGRTKELGPLWRMCPSPPANGASAERSCPHEDKRRSGFSARRYLIFSQLPTWSLNHA